MSIHNIADVGAQPVLTLQPWLIIECANGLRYATGWCVENREGRASTPIVEFDRESMWLHTRSGRVYHLEGPPGLDADAAYVWGGYAAVNGLTGEIDVTAAYWPGWSGVEKVVDTALAEIAKAMLAAGYP